MAYTERNFRTKKELKEALDNGENIRVYHSGLGTVPENGTVFLEGRHFPQRHVWYGEGIMVDGLLVKVK